MKKYLIGFLTLAALCVAPYANAQTGSMKGEVISRKMEAAGKNETNRSFGMEAQEATPDKIRSDASTGTVEVAVDRADLTYAEGDLAEITVRSSVGGYLYLVSFDSKEEATLLFPNGWNSDNRISAGDLMTYPAADQNFVLRIVGPNFGQETICAYVTREEIKELKGIKYGKNATDISGVIKDLEKTLQERAAKDYRGAKPICLEERPSADAEPELTIGKCVYYTQASRSGADSRRVSKTGRRIFVGFGVNVYKSKQINPLHCCANDAKAMAEVAVNYWGVDKESCVVLTDEEVTLANVSKVFNEVLPKYTRPGDQVFVYWSGHGDRLASGTTRQNDCFLVPHDADLNDYNTMLNEHAFGNWLKNNLAGRDIILFLDACHSGGMLLGGGKSLGGRQSLDDLVKGKDFVFDFGVGAAQSGSKSLGHVGMFAMASSSAEQLSFEGSRSLGLSVATHYLIETIVNGDSSLTHKDLVDEIRPLVSAYVKKERPGSDQTIVAEDQLNPAVRLIVK